MKNIKIKGFSLAEVMITMIVLSIALSAAIPTITRRNAGTDNIWQMGVVNNQTDVSTIAYTGPNIMIGATRLPMLSGFDKYFPDTALAPLASATRHYPKNDKLIIFRNIDIDANRFTASHMGFYNKSNGQTEYAGRLASDKYNLAFGIGALQSLQPNYDDPDNLIGVYNTAIGHYALFTNMLGSYNTAYGYNALRGNNFLDSFNRPFNNNIAVGDNALRNINGSNNIAIGSYAGANVTGSDNILLGANAGGDAVDNNIIIGPSAKFNYSIERVMRGDRAEGTYPRVSQNDNFILGPVNSNATASLPIMQGFLRTQRGTDDGCVDGICHAKGVTINTENFYLNTAGVEDSTGKVTELPKPIFAIRSSVESKAMNIAQATVRPCGGAPICLAPFSVTTGSFYSAQENEGFLGKAEKYNTYNRKTSYPRFKYNKATTITYSNLDTTKVNYTSLPNDPVYDLYIGSIFATDSAFSSENNKVLSSNDHTKYSKLLIDVGKEETNDPINNARITGLVAEDGTIIGNLTDAVRPPVLINKHSLKIRTVKTAMNFLDEMKEKSNWLEMLHAKVDYNWNCIFNTDVNGCLGKENTFCSTSGEKSDWDKIKQCDPAFYKENNKDLLGGFCDYVWEQRNKRSELINKLKDCISSSDGLISCVINVVSDARLKNILGDNTDGIDKIKKLKIYNYTYKADKAQTPHVGVMAQDLKKVFPNAVKMSSDGYYKIRLEDMFYAMINSVKELSNRKDDLDALTKEYIDDPLMELDKQNVDIKSQNELLKQKNLEIEKRLSSLEAK